jgi:hypothetical protein
MDVPSAPPGDLPPAAASPDEVARFVAEAALHAPSVRNSAPWWFSTEDSAICVRADLERKLAVADPAGRELIISCGAAVFTARIALRYLGLLPKVSVLPEADVPDLIARIGWDAERRPPGDYERGLFGEIPKWHARRGGFDTDRLPVGLMSRFVEEAARENVKLAVMAADDHRAAVLAVMTAADSALKLDQARASEGATWVPPGDTDRGEAPGSPASAGIVTVLTTAADQKADWVSAGQALQRVLLVAGSHGAAVAVSGRALGFVQLREFIRSELTGGDFPQLVLRFGMMRHPAGG